MEMATLVAPDVYQRRRRLARATIEARESACAPST
jgi:hypothetical protein